MSCVLYLLVCLCQSIFKIAGLSYSHGQIKAIDEELNSTDPGKNHRSVGHQFHYSRRQSDNGIDGVDRELQSILRQIDHAIESDRQLITGSYAIVEQLGYRIATSRKRISSFSLPSVIFGGLRTMRQGIGHDGQSLGKSSPLLHGFTNLIPITKQRFSDPIVYGIGPAQELARGIDRGNSDVQSGRDLSERFVEFNSPVQASEMGFKTILRIFDIVLYEFPWLDIMPINVFAGFVFYRIADSFSGCSIDDSKINLRGTIIGLVIRGHILNGRVWITRQTGFYARRVFDIARSMECNGRTVIIGSRQAPFVLITSSHHHCMLAQHRVIGRVSSSQRIHDSLPFGVTG